MAGRRALSVMTIAKPRKDRHKPQTTNGSLHDELTSERRLFSEASAR